MTQARADIRPIVLAGGSGTRLWPRSRAGFPKQFAQLVGDESLFQSAILRVHGDGFSAPIVVTAEPFRFIVLEQLDAIGVSAAAVLIEPEAKNTAPAVAAALAWVDKEDADAPILVTPSDHAITNAEAFRAAALEASEHDSIMTFGIAPTRPETGYGWLELAADVAGKAPYPLRRFVEKPDPTKAQEMLESGGYLWNAGIFLGPSQVFRTEFDTHAPKLRAKAVEALDAAEQELGFIRLDRKAWSGVDAISFDHAVMEKASNLHVLPWDYGWSDLGSWDAIWREKGSGTVCDGTAEAINCEDTYLSSPDGQRLVGIGLNDIVAVALPDAVLVTTRASAQDVGQAVEILSSQNAHQAHEFARDHRPWGWFETLAVEERFRVKRIVVKPGGRLSLQAHQRRAEHWVIVEGTAQVTIGDRKRRLGENQSVYVPVGARHRLENESDGDLVLIEVQTGAYLGEDDIERFDDAYLRD
ncbi:MAG: mannose-1-phosphate guanylyltransferase/mannose-6-phosphate isomerase [Boseongicola sp.]|nr:mannose-1-phosphate guanylyltransferase/mannose-6-phosphate isomerase [Boseongicola sp.]NNJ68704.1 mannose-1-phosphate guanylyltransferase/mannose-6-phosphate isomerase [Boseongicola sp.]